MREKLSETMRRVSHAKPVLDLSNVGGLWKDVNSGLSLEFGSFSHARAVHGRFTKWMGSRTYTDWNAYRQAQGLRRLLLRRLLLPFGDGMVPLFETVGAPTTLGKALKEAFWGQEGWTAHEHHLSYSDVVAAIGAHEHRYSIFFFFVFFCLLFCSFFSRLS